MHNFKIFPNRSPFAKLYYLLFSVLFIQISFAQQQNKLKYFDKYLEEFLVNKKVPSISAGILKDYKILWLGVKGYADLENNVPASFNSEYRIASISKPITAVAIMQLYEKGLIDIDKDARTYIPSFPEKKWKFTIRQILSHTSGIRNYREGEFNSKNFYASTNEAIKVFAYDSLNFEPGTKYEYTSLGYSLLAAIIENVTKNSFEDYLKNNIFIPANMQNTFVDKQRSIIPNRVKGYEKNYLREFINAPLADLSIKVAGGGLLSNSRDLLLFIKALLEGKLIKRSTFEVMCSPTKLKSGKELEYGLGFSIKTMNDSLKAVYHYGNGTGFSSLLYINLEKNIAAVNLINIVDRNLNAPAEDLISIELTNKYIFPLKTLSDELMSVYRSFGIDSTLNKFNEIADSSAEFYNLSENELIAFSNDLIGLNKTKDAIIYLRGLLKRYSKSFAVVVAIADAYLKDQNEGLALKFYRTAQQLNNNDAYVKRMISKLNKMK